MFFFFLRKLPACIPLFASFMIQKYIGSTGITNHVLCSFIMLKPGSVGGNVLVYSVL